MRRTLPLALFALTAGPLGGQYDPETSTVPGAYSPLHNRSRNLAMQPALVP